MLWAAMRHSFSDCPWDSSRPCSSRAWTTPQRCVHIEWVRPNKAEITPRCQVITLDLELHSSMYSCWMLCQSTEILPYSRLSTPIQSWDSAAVIVSSVATAENSAAGSRREMVRIQHSVMSGWVRRSCSLCRRWSKPVRKAVVMPSSEQKGTCDARS